jgi:NADH-quinone oxidoreductase subunit M
MSLVLLLVIPFAGGVAAWLAARWSVTACRWSALAASLASLGLAMSLWARHFGGLAGAAVAGTASSTSGAPGQATAAANAFVLHFDVPWIPQAGIRFHLAVDGLSLIMLMLTFAVVTLALLSSWKGVRQRTGLFYFQIMWAAASLAGVFMALDLFLFYFFFEMMLVPFFFLIVLWGHEQRRRAALKFFIYTQAGGLLMLISIVALYFVHGRESGVYTFDYLQLIGTSFSGWTGLLLMLGFFAAFAVKLPAVPFHGWLPDAHSQANTAGSVLLAGLLIKVGAYGFLRFLVPLFPGTAFDFRYVAMGLGVAGILYGAVMAFSQTDLKRMVAYTSVSHMGFILLGVFAWNEIAIQGVVLQIVCHAFSTGGLFILAGVLEQRLGTRDLGGMGGLWARLSTLGGFGMFLAMAALGLPGLGNFVAEFLILLGAFSVSRPAAIVGSLGLVVSTVYALWMVQKVFHGPGSASARPEAATPGRETASFGRRSERGTERRGLSVREIVMFAVAVIVLLWLGLYPQTLIRTMKPSTDFLLQSAPSASAPSAAASSVTGPTTTVPGGAVPGASSTAEARP